MEENTVEETFAFKNQHDWLQSMQSAPKKEWVKERSLGSGKKSIYMPIEVQEALADYYFKRHDIIDQKVEIYHGKNSDQLLVHVKIEVIGNYPFAEPRIISGVSGKQIQATKNSLEYNAGACMSSAKSDALSRFANIFGRNLNRDIQASFSFIKEKKDESNK